MHVAKDGTKSWSIRYALNGRETTETFADERGARRFASWLDRLGVEEARRLLVASQDATGDEHTVASWCTEHVDHLTGVTTGTVARYRSYIARDLGSLGELPLAAVTARHVGAWVVAMERAGASGKTIKNKHGFLSACFATAAAAGHVASNPCRGTRLPTSITEPMVFLTQEEYVRFLGCVTPRWQPLVEVLFGTGMRWGEVTALQVGDVDLQAGTITITRAWKEAPVATLGAPKSRRSRRTIDLAAETVAALRPLVEGRPADALVFVNARGEAVKGATFHDNVWQPAVRLANGEPAQAGKRIARRKDAAGELLQPLSPPLGKRPRIHDARHSCASWLLGAGIPINYVQAHLGHESITTTVDRYGHIMPAKRQAISGALSAALAASRPQLA